MLDFTSKKQILICLFLIVLLGAGLRFYDLAAESLWTDEMISLIHIQKDSFTSLIHSVLDYELIPPGYFILLNGWAHFFGETEFYLRFLSALFDSISIILIYFLGKKIFDSKVGLWSALIFSTSMLPLVYAQEARPYAFFGFLVLLSSYLLAIICTDQLGSTQKYYFFSYMIIITLSLYVDYMTLFVLMFHSLFILIYFYRKDKSILKKQLLFSIGALIIFIPGLQLMLIQALIRQPALQERLLLWGVPQIMSNLGIIFYLLPIILMFTGTIILFFYVKDRLFRKIKLQGIIFISLFFWVIFCILQVIFLDKIIRSFALVRHSFFVVPFCYILISKANSLILNKRIKALVLISIIVFNGITLVYYYQQTTKAPWNEAIAFLGINSPSNSLVLFDRSGANADLFNYYLKQNSGLNFRQLNLSWSEKRQLVMIDEKYLFKQLDLESSFWLVSSRNIKTRDYYQELLKEKYPLVLEKKYKELELYYFKSSN